MALVVVIEPVLKLYIIIFDQPPSNTSSIESDLIGFGASHVNNSPDRFMESKSHTVEGCHS